MNQVLIIDDEDQIRRLLRMILESRGFAVREAATGEAGLVDAAFHNTDAILLDLGLPDIDGVEVLRRLREWTDVPVLVLSVRNQEAVKVEALECGADDYVTKPFGTGELLARLSAIQRRRFLRHSPEIEAGPVLINLLHHEAFLNQQPIKLTPIEFNVLKVLAENYGRIVTQSQLLERVWPTQSTAAEVLRVHIARLRRKLENGGIQVSNEPGIGYRLEAEPAQESE